MTPLLAVYENHGKKRYDIRMTWGLRRQANRWTRCLCG